MHYNSEEELLEHLKADRLDHYKRHNPYLLLKELLKRLATLATTFYWEDMFDEIFEKIRIYPEEKELRSKVKNVLNQFREESKGKNSEKIDELVGSYTEDILDIILGDDKSSKEKFKDEYENTNRA